MSKKIKLIYDYYENQNAYYGFEITDDDKINKDEYLDLFYGISGLKSGEGFACRIFDNNLQWITKNSLYYELMGDQKVNYLTFDTIWDDHYNPVITNDIQEYKMISNDYIRNAYYKLKKTN